MHRVQTKKACMVAYAFYENDARIRRYVDSLIAKGWKVDIIALRTKNQSRFEVINGAKIYRIQTRERNEKNKWQYFFRILLFFWQSFFFLSRHHLRSPYSFIHVHSIPDFEVFATLLAKLIGAKIILDIHDLVPEFYSNKFNAQPGSFMVRALLLLEKICCGFADQVIVANDIWAEKLMIRSVKSTKCSAIINYPDLHIFHPLTHNAQEKNHFTLLYPGSLHYHQGVDLAIKAIAIVKEVIPQVKLHIYGDGPEKQNLLNLIKQLGLDYIVELHEPVELSRIVRVMANADVGIVPKRADSFGNEAFSTKIMEFMAMGIPVIVSDTKIDRFYFDPSIVMFFQAGNEHDLAEKVITLYHNPKLREQLAINSINFIKDNNWQIKEKLYFRIINSVLGEKLLPE